MKAFLSNSPLAAANGLMLAIEVMKKIGLVAMKELLENQHCRLNSELSCLEPVRSFITDSDSDADHLFMSLSDLCLSLPDEKNLIEVLKSNTEVSVLSKFVCNCSQLQSGGSLLPKLLKIYQFLHRDLAYELSEEEVEDMTLLQLLEKMNDLYPGMVHFNPFEHNEYVRTVMGNSNYLLLDETNIKQLLSVGNDSGYLLDVIKHIVSS